MPKRRPFRRQTFPCLWPQQQLSRTGGGCSCCTSDVPSHDSCSHDSDSHTHTHSHISAQDHYVVSLSSRLFSLLKEGEEQARAEEAKREEREERGEQGREERLSEGESERGIHGIKRNLLTSNFGATAPLLPLLLQQPLCRVCVCVSSRVLHE